MSYLEILVPVVGSAGTAVGLVDSDAEIRGIVHAIQIVYNGQPATADVVVSEIGGLGRTLLTVSNSNTNSINYPFVAISESVIQPYVELSRIRVAVENGNPGSVFVRLLVM